MFCFKAFIFHLRFPIWPATQMKYHMSGVSETDTHSSEGTGNSCSAAETKPCSGLAQFSDPHALQWNKAVELAPFHRWNSQGSLREWLVWEHRHPLLSLLRNILMGLYFWEAEFQHFRFDIQGSPRLTPLSFIAICLISLPHSHRTAAKMTYALFPYRKHPHLPFYPLGGPGLPSPCLQNPLHCEVQLSAVFSMKWPIAHSQNSFLPRGHALFDL